jgi:GNAT superfamily N-acetyltransferase
MPGADIALPVHLNDAHDLSSFSCGNDSLDNWLKTHARRSEGLSGRTYVVYAGATLLGYYTLATAGEKRENTSGKLRRNSPEQIPLMILARLAIDSRYQRQGIGQGLLKDAMSRTMQAAQIAGIRALLVHAIDDDAKDFYEKFGFREFPSASRKLYLPIETMLALV